MDDDGRGKASVCCRATQYKVDSAKVEHLVGYLCQLLGVANHEVNIEFVGSDEIRKLNAQYRGIDQATDVLSFPQKNWKTPLCARTDVSRQKGKKTSSALTGPPETLGDVVISLPEAEHNASKIGHELDREVGFLLVHGILHLCGHDHERSEDEERMLGEQRKIMDIIGTSCAPPLWRRSAEAPKRA